MVWYDVKYKFEVDFADDEVAIKDAYVAYAGLKPKDWGIGEIRFGNQYVYNSLEEITELALHHLHGARGFHRGVLPGSSDRRRHTGRWRALVVPDRRLRCVRSREDDDFLQDRDRTYSARVTVAPINRDVNGVNQVLHFGVSGRHRDEARGLAGRRHRCDGT